jgi:tellurite resistance protein TerB
VLTGLSLGVVVGHDKVSEKYQSESMSKVIQRARSLLAKHKERTRDRQFLDAAMAASALVAGADGEVSLAELLSRDEILARVEALQAFDSNAAVDSFRAFLDGIEADPEKGTAAALEAVAKFGDDAEMAQLLLRAAMAIAKADAEFSSEEQLVIAGLCEALGMESVDLDSD